jgi:hypothetical protein
MNCPKCGEHVEDDLDDCPSCGASLNDGSDTTQSEPLYHCEECQEELEYISTYKQWYCYNCQNYVDLPAPGESPATKTIEEPTTSDELEDQFERSIEPSSEDHSTAIDDDDNVEDGLVEENGHDFEDTEEDETSPEISWNENEGEDDDDEQNDINDGVEVDLPEDDESDDEDSEFGLKEEELKWDEAFDTDDDEETDSESDAVEVTLPSEDDFSEDDDDDSDLESEDKAIKLPETSVPDISETENVELELDDEPSEYEDNEEEDELAISEDDFSDEISDEPGDLEGDDEPLIIIEEPPQTLESGSDNGFLDRLHQAWVQVNNLKGLAPENARLSELEEELNIALKGDLEPDNALQLAEDSLKEVPCLEKELKESIHHKVSELFHFVNSKIFLAKKIGFEVEEIEENLDNTSSLIARSEYHQARKNLEELLQQILDLPNTQDEIMIGLDENDEAIAELLEPQGQVESSS